MRTIAIPALAALLAACSGGPSEPAAPEHVRFAVLAASHRAGDTLRMELRNGGSRDVGYNFCDARLQRMEGSGWATDERYPLHPVCLAMLFRLEPGQTAPTFRVLPAGIEPGTYRLRLDVSVGAAIGSAVTTGPFTVSR